MDVFKTAGLILKAYHRQYLDEKGELERWIHEQVIYRSHICKDCMDVKKCKNCFCDLPAMFFIDKEKSKCPYPKLMGEKEWEEFKQENKITLDYEQQRE